MVGDGLGVVSACIGTQVETAQPCSTSTTTADTSSLRCSASTAAGAVALQHASEAVGDGKQGTLGGVGAHVAIEQGTLGGELGEGGLHTPHRRGSVDSIGVSRHPKWS